MKKSKCLILGCGYLGTRVARRWQTAGHDVFVTTRSTDRAERFAALGWNPIVMDVTRAAPPLPTVDYMLCAVGYDRSAQPSQHAVYVDGLRRALDALPAAPERILYISSTGVYGQSDDQWIDEESACVPERTGGQACLAAEQVLRDHRCGQQAIILRLAGIYGPGRVPYLDRLRSGKPLAVETSGYLNLIHVDDAVSVVNASLGIDPPELFVVADMQPVVRRQYYDQIGAILGLEIQYTDPRADDSRRGRAASSKRVRNRKMMKRLGIALEYPTYQHGLRAILNSGETARDSTE